MSNSMSPMVLVIDDEKAIRKSIKFFLEDNDYPETLGPELVSNSTFDTDIAGWSGIGGAVLSHVSNELAICS